MTDVVSFPKVYRQLDSALEAVHQLQTATVNDLEDVSALASKVVAAARDLGAQAQNEGIDVVELRKRVMSVVAIVDRLAGEMRTTSNDLSYRITTAS